MNSQVIIGNARMNASPSNVKLNDDQEMFYMRVHWQMECERGKEIKLGLELDKELRQLNKRMEP